MAGIARVVAVLKALALLSWRDVRSLGSIAGQNFFLFVLFVALQPESAAFFGMLLLVVLMLPLASDPMQKVPEDRRVSWPMLRWEWRAVRLTSVLLSPISWVGLLLLVRAGWRLAVVVFAVGAVLYLARAFWRFPSGWPFRLPAPPGVIGAIMRLQWRTMLHTLDPYLALTLAASTEIYRIFGKALDPAAPRIMALLVTLALSTEAQVLFGLDGKGAERYRQLPIRGWQILLAKDLGFLSLLGLLVLPLDFVSGIFGGIAALAVGHHHSVCRPVPQARWRFTSGALFPHGVVQTAALFAVGTVVRTEVVPMVSLSLVAWAASVFFYGRQWERQTLR